MVGETYESMERNLIKHLTDAGLTDVKGSGYPTGTVAHFDLLAVPDSASARKNIVKKAMELMSGKDMEILNNHYYFNFPNTPKSYGILGIAFEEFKGSRSGSHAHKYKYLQNRGRVNLQIKPLEPEMKDDQFYTNPKDVGYA